MRSLVAFLVFLSLSFTIQASEIIGGCTDPAVFNYDPSAEFDDGTCNPVIVGCLDETACNFDDGADFDDSTCEYASEGCDCLGACLLETDDGGGCDEFEIFGCTDTNAINYDSAYTEDNSSCVYPPELSQPPAEFDFTPTPMSGTFYGTIQIEGVMATGLDWVAAFDETGNCAGANSVLMNEGVAYANLSIYGDDMTTSLADEGMNPGEDFTLVFYDTSEDLFITYVDSLGNEFLSGWENNYGAPIPAWNNPLTIFNFNNYVPCPGDFNEDGHVQLFDLLDFLIAYGSICNGCPQDLNNDGIVQVTDLIDFLLLFGNFCE